MKSKTFSFRQLFSTLFLLFVGLLAATALQAWTGPTATAPAGNVAAPINVGTTDQVKDAGISVNSLAVFGSQYIQDELGIGRTSPVVALDVNGTLRLANGGEVCQAVTAGAVRFNSSTSKLEYCNGTAWMQVDSSYAVAASSQTYSSAGTFSFTVPSYNTLVVTANGAGGGGGSLDYTGSTGGLSKFVAATEVQGNGGGGGRCSTYRSDESASCTGGVGDGGTATGGETNTTGGSPSNGGAGGSLSGYGTGGTGGKGGQAVKTWSQGAPGAPAIGSAYSVVVGAGGAGAAAGAGTSGGAAGQAGSVVISWY